jgi:hypothetical protein
MLTAAAMLSAALAGVLPLLVGILSTALLLAGFLLAALMLLSALVRVVRHDASFQINDGRTTVGLSTSSD